MNCRTLISLEPVGRTGGRAYLRMVHEIASRVGRVELVPDFKRTYTTRYGRKMRHLSRMASVVTACRRKGSVYIWDDMSVLWFDDHMLARTVFILHHVEPLQFDSNPLEPWLWQRMFAVLNRCRAVVCVSPFWRRFLALKGIRSRIIFNSFDLAEIVQARLTDKLELRDRFRLPSGKTVVYLGKAVHWKGVERVAAVLGAESDLHLVTSGSRTVSVATDHRELYHYSDYLKLVRACDVGVFAPVLHEGWSRCAAESILVGLPCLMNSAAGLGDLARLTSQPRARIHSLADDVRARAADGVDTDAAFAVLSRFDRAYFAQEWESLIDEVCS